jgi:RND family efflux transporter MFP subunit
VKALEAYEFISAPFQGIVTARYVDPGALLPAATAATASAQPLLEVTDMSRVRVYVYLGQPDASFVRDDTPVELSSDVHPGQVLPAKVARISRELDPRTRTMLTEIDLDNQNDWLYPGLYLQVTLSLETPPALMVPSDAVFIRDGKPHVALIEQGRARFVPVVTGEDDGREIRLLGGVREGQMVALHIGDEVSDGVRVRAVPAPSASG